MKQEKVVIEKLNPQEILVLLQELNKQVNEIEKSFAETNRNIQNLKATQEKLIQALAIKTAELDYHSDVKRSINLE